MENIKNVNNVNIGNCGEYYVAAELERRGFTVALPMSNVDNFDILARSKKTNKQYAIQVKTTTKKSWLLNKKAENLVEDDTFYVFVRIIGDKFPEFYVHSSKDVADMVKEEHVKWLNTAGKNGAKHNDNAMRSFKYLFNRDRWDLLE